MEWDSFGFIDEYNGMAWSMYIRARRRVKMARAIQLRIITTIQKYTTRNR